MEVAESSRCLRLHSSYVQLSSAKRRRFRRDAVERYKMQQRLGRAPPLDRGTLLSFRNESLPLKVVAVDQLRHSEPRSLMRFRIQLGEMLPFQHSEDSVAFPSSQVTVDTASMVLEHFEAPFAGSPDTAWDTSEVVTSLNASLREAEQQLVVMRVGQAQLKAAYRALAEKDVEISNLKQALSLGSYSRTQQPLDVMPGKCTPEMLVSPFDDIDFCRELLVSFYADHWHNKTQVAQDMYEEARWLFDRLQPLAWQTTSQASQKYILGQCQKFAQRLDGSLMEAIIGDYIEIVQGGLAKEENADELSKNSKALDVMD